MSVLPSSIQPNANQQRVRSYYRLHAKIYDLTRWSFLFGRDRLLQSVIAKNPKTIVELGCGTGRNLSTLSAALPNARLFGVDLSWEMLARAHSKLENSIALAHSHPSESQLRTKAQTRITLICASEIPHTVPKCDAILMSYVLTMTADQYQEVLRKAYSRLSEGGVLAIVDFHSTPFLWFKRWMGANHVRISPTLKQTLVDDYQCKIVEKKAYFGLWRYFLAYAER